jgi:hypothetical protein
MYFFLFFLEYPHNFLKGETSLIQGLLLPLSISTLPENRTCILTFAVI